MRMFAVVWFAVSLACLAFLLTSNSWMAALLYGYSLYALIGVGHNYSHRNSQWGRVMDLTAYPRHLWQVSHCLSHHSYANLELDLEVITFEPFLYFLTSQPKNPKAVLFYQFVFFSTTPLLLFITQIVDVVIGREHFRIEQLLLPAQFGLAYYLHGGSGLLLMAVAHILNGILFMQFSFPTHRTLGVWTEGDPNPTRDFAIHTLRVVA